MRKGFIPPLLLEQSTYELEKRVRWDIRKDIEKRVKPAVEAAKGVDVDPSSFRTTDLNRWGVTTALSHFQHRAGI